CNPVTIPQDFTWKRISLFIKLLWSLEVSVVGDLVLFPDTVDNSLISPTTSGDRSDSSVFWTEDVSVSKGSGLNTTQTVAVNQVTSNVGFQNHTPISSELNTATELRLGWVAIRQQES